MVSLDPYIVWDPTEYHLFGMAYQVQIVQEFHDERVIHFSIFDRRKYREGIRIDDESF